MGELSSLAEKEVAMSRQKARVEWGKNGDTNSLSFSTLGLD